MLGGVVGWAGSIVILFHLVQIIHVVIQRQIFDAFFWIFEIFRLWFNEIITWFGLF